MIEEPQLSGFSFLYICFMAFGASVNTVYQTLKHLVNKEQNGFITPDVFNSFAQIAQVRIFNRMFDQIKDSRRLSRASFESGRDKSRFKQIQEDLAYFSKTVRIDKNFNEDVFEKPDDLARIISATTYGTILLGQSTRRNIELLYDEEKIDRILVSDLSMPTQDYPVALINDNIEVFPDSIHQISLRYYKYPEGRSTATGARVAQQPRFNYDVVNDQDTYIPDSSVDFELPESYVSDLVIEIGSLAGINLRDKDVVQYTGQEMVMKTREETF